VAGVNAALRVTNSLTVDWTYSPFVALFFAVEKAKASCAVWAIDMDWIIERAEALDKDFEIVRDEDPLLKSGYFFNLIFDL
jgi:hypothetical protein